MTLSDDGFKEVLNVVCTPSGKHSVGCNYGSAPDSLSVCNLAPDDPYLLQFLWECLNILPMDSLRSEEIEKTKDDSYYVLSFQKLGDEYEVGLTRKYRSFQNTTTTYRLKLNCLDPGNTPFPSGYSEWLMDVGDESHLIMMEPIWRRIT